MNLILNPLSNGLIDSVPIYKYVQTQPILTSQQVQVPPGTKRIEALMAGGGGGGSGGASGSVQGMGGGFGGLAIMLIPVTGSALDITIGAGGASTVTSTGNDGSPSQIYSAGMLYATVGGGGGGVDSSSMPRPGTFGGACGGNPGTTTSYGAVSLAHGSLPPMGLLLWHAYPHVKMTNSGQSYTGVAGPTVSVPPQPGQGFGSMSTYSGSGGIYYYSSASSGSFGGGPGCELSNSSAFFGAGGGPTVAPIGGGGGSGYAPTSGGSFTSISIWGYTGFSGGSGIADGGGGGGGLLGSGFNGATSIGGAGARGAGGGGGKGTGGAGGNGYVVLRFYL